MTADYFESKKTGGSKDSIEITLEVKADKVVDFANEIASYVKDATIDRVLEIINSWKEFNMGAHKSVLNMISNEILALKGVSRDD